MDFPHFNIRKASITAYGQLIIAAHKLNHTLRKLTVTLKMSGFMVYCNCFGLIAPKPKLIYFH